MCISKATTANPLDSFSDSSAWQPYFPCFIDNLLFLHDDVVPRDDLGACQICHCNKGEVDCKEKPDCKEKDCTYNKVFLIHGQTINVDFSPQQNEHGTCEICQCNNGNVTCHETSECSQKDCIHNKVNILKHGQVIDIEQCPCSCVNGEVTCDPTCTEGESSPPSTSSSAGLLPCSYRGTPILHGESLIVDECTVCSCDNSTVKCDIKSCGIIWCDAPLTFEGECCEVCPYCEYNQLGLYIYKVPNMKWIEL